MATSPLPEGGKTRLEGAPQKGCGSGLRFWEGWERLRGVMNALRKILWSGVVAGVVVGLCGGVAWGEPEEGESAAEVSWVRVTGDRVNLRAKPGFENSEVLGQADYDERLEVRELGDEWVGVVAPERVSLWVSSQYVREPENVIGANRVNVRTGPSQNHTIALVLTRGTPVSVREKVGDWSRIAVPDGALVWISRQFAEVVDEGTPAAAVASNAGALENPILKWAESTGALHKPEAVVAETAEPAEAADVAETEAEAVAEVVPPEVSEPAQVVEVLEPVAAEDAGALARPERRKGDRPAPPVEARPLPDVAVATAEPEMPTPIVLPSVPAKDAAEEAGKKNTNPAGVPASFKLIPLEGQGRQVTYEGVLRAAPLFNQAPARYRVLRWNAASARWELQCHVYGEASKFRYLQDKSVRVRGREYWLQDTAAPVLMPDQIQELLPTDMVK